MVHAEVLEKVRAFFKHDTYLINNHLKI